MDLQEFKTLDPQRVIKVRFGYQDMDTGHVEWDNWIDVRLLVSHEDITSGVWTITPLSLDGRPASFYLLGHNDPVGTQGIFASPNAPHVMQVRSFLETPLLLEASIACQEGVHNSMAKALAAAHLRDEDLSRAGNLFVEAVEGFLRGDLSEDLMERLRDVMRKS